MIILTILTILNSFGIIVLLFKLKVITVSIRRDQTTWDKILTGYEIWINEFYIRIPIRNKRKVELSEEVGRMITYSDHGKGQTLRAKFSWLRTWKEVRQFERDYAVVDREIVENLVKGFTPKNETQTA